MKDQEDGLKKLLTWFLNLVIQFEAMEQIDAEPYQCVGSRKAHRNGYKERSLKTRVGELKLKKAQFRGIPFQTKVFDRYSRVESALINAIIESYLQGVSIRRVQDIVSRLGIEDLSASSVSRIAKELDEKVEQFLKRPLEHPIHYLFVDASYFKVRTDSRYASWQMCHVHLVRAVLRNVAKKYHKEIADKLKIALEDETKIQELILELESRGYSKAADTLESFQFSLWNYRSFPPSHHRRIRTTNELERINKELKRRTRVVGVFPSDQSFMILGVSILIDINEEWMTT